MLKKAIIGLPLSLMIALFCFEGKAYTFTQDYQRGSYWATLPLAMTRFAVDQSDGQLLQTIVDEAVTEWESATGKNIWSISPVQNSSSYSGNYIRWSYNFAEETGYDATRTLALTIRYNSGTHFDQVVMIINAQIGYLRQNFGGALKKTILHELGHTVGLDHSDQVAMMAASISAISTLQDDDIRGMNAILDDTSFKQQTGYVSPYAVAESSEKNKLAACGTVEDIGSGGGDGSLRFIQSLMIGLMVVVLKRVARNLWFIPKVN